MSISTKMALSSKVSNPLSRNLSYTNSLDPGEDSQLIALAMVDKLVDCGADFAWQAPKLSKEAEQASIKGSQSVKGVQVLAQSADAKNRQSFFGVFDWIDSQHNDAEKDFSSIIMQSEFINKQKENKDVECQPMQSSDFKATLNNKQDNLDAQCDREDALPLDIGTNTQVALEAIDIMMNGSPRSCPCDKEESFSVTDIGSNTQTALDAIDILRCSMEPNTKQKRKEECKNVVQVKGPLPGATSDRKRSLPPRSRTSVPKPYGKKGSRTSIPKPYGKKGSRSRTSKVPKKMANISSLKFPITDFCENKRLVLDFSCVVVPRRKRSRRHAPRVLINKNLEAFGHQEGRPNPTLDGVKQDKAEGAKLAKNTDFAQVTVSTYVRRTKRDLSTMPDCCIFLEQGRKRRKCESKSVFVLFSHGLSEVIINEQKKILKKLGGHVAASAAKATHFIANCFVRSRNMLEIMAAGKAVVTTNWLEGCSQAQYFVHEETYMLKDSQKEKEWGFCMHSSLAASRRRPLLQGMTVVVSPNTLPEFSAIKSIIESGGGQVLEISTSDQLLSDGEKALISFVLASEEDFDCCAQYISHGVGVFSTELLLHGVVTQSFDFSRNRLFVK